MSEYLDDYENALRALERLYGETSGAANNAAGLEDKASLVRLARQIATIREKLRLLYYDVRDANAGVVANRCICPTASKAGQQWPTIIDKSCNAYRHGGAENI